LYETATEVDKFRTGEIYSEHDVEVRLWKMQDRRCFDQPLKNDETDSAGYEP